MAELRGTLCRLRQEYPGLSRVVRLGIYPAEQVWSPHLRLLANLGSRYHNERNIVHFDLGFQVIVLLHHIVIQRFKYRKEHIRGVALDVADYVLRKAGGAYALAAWV